MTTDLLSKGAASGATVVLPQVHPHQAPVHPLGTLKNKENHFALRLAQGAEGAPEGASFFTLAEAVQITNVKRQPLSRRLERLNLLQDRTIETGPNKGRIGKVIFAEDLFRLYPEARRTFVNTRSIQAQLAEPPAPAVAPPKDSNSIPSFKDWQRRRMDARLGLLQHIETLVREGLSRERAVNRLVADAEAGRLPVDIQALVPLANARSGQNGDRTLSRRTLQRWSAEAKQGMEHLAPRAPERPEPRWAQPLLDLYRQPQKPALRHVVLDLLPQVLPDGIQPPSYDAARRYFLKVGALELQKGRMLPRELKNEQPFCRRSFDHLEPMDVTTCDGHTFDAEVQHPSSRTAFKPELTTIVDYATRMIVGWSAGEAESALVVTDAFRQAVMEYGVALIFYVDNGSGYKNRNVRPIMDRLGVHMTHSRPYNSRARGVIERIQQTVWVNFGAKKLSSYIGKDMDRQAGQIVHKLSRKDPAKYLMPWDTFLAFCEALVQAYNHKPHGSLPMIVDPETGRKRHMTPAERMESFVAEGWEPRKAGVDLTDFLPEEIRQVRKGEISINGYTYFSRDLKQYQGDDVRVAWDVRDASKVWIRDLEGVFICEAGFQANVRPVFPIPMIERLRYQREENQLKRLEKKGADILAKRPEAPLQISVLTPSVMEASAEQMRKFGLPTLPEASREVEIELEEASEPRQESIRPSFADGKEYANWILDHPDRADPEELAEIQSRLRRDSIYRTWLGRDDAALA